MIREICRCHNSLDTEIPVRPPRFSTDLHRPRLVIIGASTRAAAWSAYRAGFQPICVDQFADCDLQRIAKVISAEYPQNIVARLTGVEADGWLFVGAMENHGQILSELQRHSELGRYFGPDLHTINSLRSPTYLATCLHDLACYPEIAFGPMPDHDGSTWLSKPIHSGGGLGMVKTDRLERSPGRYLQRYIAGIPMSVLYCVSDRGADRLLVCEQLIGLSESSPPNAFAYCGAILERSLASEQAAFLDQIVRALLEGLHYRGLIGIDLVWDGDQFWVIEVDPRYTASTELWELTSQQSAIERHIAAFGSSAFSLQHYPGITHGYDRTDSLPVLGKAILYADKALKSPNFERFLCDHPLWSIPWLADVPETGSVFPPGAPICTVFASGAEKETCRSKLIRRLRRVRSWMFDVS